MVLVGSCRVILDSFLAVQPWKKNKTFQHKDAKTNITTKTDSGFVIILSILLACCISGGFVRNATQWQTELYLWKINYFDWIFKRYFNMVPLHITYEAWNASEHSISHLAGQECNTDCRKVFHCICNYSFQLVERGSLIWLTVTSLECIHPSWKVLIQACTSPGAHTSSQISHNSAYMRKW